MSEETGGLLSQLNSQSLRSLIARNQPEVKCIARFLAAYFIDLPLFTQPAEEPYPSLFAWVNIREQDVVSPKQCLDRSQIRLSADISPRLPIVLFLHVDLPLEAILYSDFFNDRRASLLLRIYTDSQLNLHLVDAYLEEMISVYVPNTLALIQSSTSSDPSLYAHIISTSFLQLDAFLCRPAVSMLQHYLLSQMETFFAQLPLQAPQEQLPRPPIYSRPETDSFASGNLDGESDILMKIHIYLSVLLCSLHETNQLDAEMRNTLAIFSNHQEKPPSTVRPLSRVLLLTLRVRYRDAFSQAVAEHWEELPEIAKKYKALLSEEEEEDDWMAFHRWITLANEQDLSHANLFFYFISENFDMQSNTLPALNEFTREVWKQKLFTTGGNKPRENEEQDWTDEVIQQNHKVDAVTLEQLHNIHIYWTVLPWNDPNLLSLIFHLKPSHMTRQKPLPTLSNENRMVQSKSVQSIDDRLFTPRQELISMYATRLRKQAREQTNAFNEAKTMRHTVREELKSIAKSQSAMEDVADRETMFLRSLSHRESQPDNPNANRSRRSLLKQFDETIRVDLNRLNNKLDDISRQLQRAASISSTMRTTNDEELMSHIYEQNGFNDEKELEDLEEDQPFNYEDVAAVATEFPTMERLDLSLLSPAPQVGKRISHTLISARSDSISENFSYNDEKFNQMEDKNAFKEEWMKLLPLKGGMSERTLLSYDLPVLRSERALRAHPPVSFERSVQTSARMDKGDSGYIEMVPTVQVQRKPPSARGMSRSQIEDVLQQK